jgi:hypothetical protein
VSLICRPLVSALSVLALLAGPTPAAAAVMAHPAPHHARKTTARRAAGGKAGRGKLAGKAGAKTAARKTAARKTAARKTAARKTAARKTAARKTAARKTAARNAAAELAAEQRAELAALARYAASAQLSAVPKQYLTWYRAAARTCSGLSWTVLAGIGTIESENGRSTVRGVHSGKNPKGAEGPMQFEPATFAEYKVRIDRSRKLTPYDPADAIYSAAWMLCADGAGTAKGLHGAVFAYNHACWYVQDVLTIASRYATQGRPTPKPKPKPHAKKQAAKKPTRTRKKPPVRHRGGQGGSQSAGAC